MNEYDNEIILLNAKLRKDSLSGRIPSDVYSKPKGPTADQFPVVNETQRYEQIGKKIFKDSIRDYLAKNHTKIFVFYQNCNYKSIKIGDLIQCKDGIKVVINITKDELHLGDSDGKKQDLKFKSKSRRKPLFTSINRKTLENFI